jgi:RHS repeat-associated protein
MYRFTGKERDTESGLDYFGARYYGSTMGRWMSPDWADKPEAVPYSQLDNPQSLNLYGYVNNNPLSKADKDGHCPECIVQALDDFAETPTGAQVVNVVGGAVTAGFAIGSGLVSDILSNGRAPSYVPGGSLTNEDGSSIFSMSSKGANAPAAATGDNANAGLKAADAPGVTAGGQAIPEAWMSSYPVRLD